MTFRILYTAAALALLPAMSFAACGHEQQASSCADGYVWDEEARTCVERVTG